MNSFYISASHKSSGKTTLSVGLAAALVQSGKKVGCFKKGPDYIDPLWLAKASQKACYNLDFNTQSKAEISRLYQQKSLGNDVCLVEGNKGLFDGMDLKGADSNAALAAWLNLPVILVLDCQGTTRGIAPLIQGYTSFAPELKFAGVILNKVAGSRHENKLRAVITHYTDLDILGAIPSRLSMLSPERHLGLIPPEENGQAEATIEWLGQQAREHIDLELLLNKTQNLQLPAIVAKGDKNSGSFEFEGLTIGVMRDAAFGFYYADDLETFQTLGAKLIFIDAIQDLNLPQCDGLFIGGGFPETHLDKLESNTVLRGNILQKAQAGLPVYAECGGLMYLARSISFKGKSAQMCGVIPADIQMHDRPQGRGLVRVIPSKECLWMYTGNKNSIQAHEFHYASMENIPGNSRFALDMQRGHGITGKKDGILINNVQAGFTHMRHTESFPWIRQFLRFVQHQKQNH